MKGVVFNLLESFVTENWGYEKYEEILSLCPLQTREPFVGPGTYPDADLMTIAAKASERLGVPLPAALRAFGRYCFPRLAAKVPTLVAPYKNACSFLQSVEPVIHVEVRKLMPQAVTPTFQYRQPEADVLVVDYSSQRKLCSLMEGLLDGLGDHFGEVIEHHQARCLHRGDSACEFHIKFATLSGRAA